MSIFKKWFGIAESEKKERASRIVTLSKVCFFTSDKKKEIPTVNISFTGVGLDGTYAEVHWKENQELGGELVFEDNRFPLILSVRHISPFVVGCKFSGNSDVLREPIEKYLKYELAGLSMRPVSTQFLNQDPRGESLWFTDGRANEIYILHKGRQLEMCHMTFFGSYFELAPGKPLRMGFIEEASPEKVHFKGSNLIRFVNKIDDRMLAVAQRFLSNVAGLPEELKTQIESNLVIHN